jgi:site-specific recombinase XerD
MKVLFWINKSRCNSRGEAALMLRITHVGKRTNVATGIRLKPKHWDSGRQKMKGSGELVERTNELIQTQRAKCIQAVQAFIKEDVAFSSSDIVDAICGQVKKEMNFLELFDLHINQMTARIGVDCAQSTVVRYRTSRKNLELFLQRKLSRADVDISRVDRKMVAQLEQFLKGELRFKESHANKCLEQIRKVYKLGLIYEYVDHNPFDLLTFRSVDSEKEFLSKDELNRLLKFETENKSLKETRDIFLFMCFTGLAHSDARKASTADIMLGSENSLWLVLKRTKTKKHIHVPVLSVVRQLIKKYSTHQKCIENKTLMPVPCNQVFNRSLKRLMAELGIQKSISSHSGRYTYASTVLLGNGVRVEVAQRLLAHDSIKSTMIYGKLSNAVLEEEVGDLEKRLGGWN